MKRSFVFLSSLALSSLPCCAAVSGTVTDRAGNGLAGVGISLALKGTSTTTDATGAWSLVATGMVARSVSKSLTRWTGNAVNLILLEPSTVSVDAFDLKGALQGRLSSMRLGAGSHSLPLALSGSGMVWLRVTMNGRPTSIVVGIGHARSLQREQQTTAARSQGVVDTLRFTWKSRVVAQVPLAIQDTSGFVVRMDTSSVYAWNDSITYGNLYDSRDGQVYRTMKIGSQNWMAENLNYAGTGRTIGRCNNNSADSCVKYGRLYTWAEAVGLPDSCNRKVCGTRVSSKHTGICPTGWHVPSDSEWTAMDRVVDSTNSTAGIKLKSTSGWIPDSATSGNGTDVYGFRALPGGYFNGTSFIYFGYVGYWWSAAENNASYARFRYMSCNGTYVNRYYHKADGFSLRCSKD